MKAFGGVEPLQYMSFREFRGIHTESPFNNNQTSLIAGSGLSLDYYPVLKSRRPVSTGTVIESSTTSTKPIAMALHNDVICVAQNAKFTTHFVGSPITFALSNSNEVSFTNFKGNLGSTHLIFSNGTDLKKFNGTTVTNLLAGGYPVTVNGFFITSHKNRLFCTSNKSTTILFSALNKADDWATANDAGSIEIDDLSNQPITAIFSNGDRLLIFRENSFYELIGTGPANFRIVQVSKEIGALNNRCVVSLNGVIYFAHYTGLYAYTSGSIPQKISTPIDSILGQDFFSATDNESVKIKTCILTDNKYIYYNPIAYGGYQQLYQYLPSVNEWIGFYEKNVQASVMKNNTFYFAERNYAGNQVTIKTLNERFAFDETTKWFAYLPLINGQTTMSSINIRSLHLRTTFAGTFDVYVMGQTKGGYQLAFPIYLQNAYFPDNTTSTVTQYGQKVFTATQATFGGLDTYPLDRGIKIPIKPNNKYTGVSVVIVGTGDFTLYEIGLEFMNMPFNNNSTVGALV